MKLSFLFQTECPEFLEERTKKVEEISAFDNEVTRFAVSCQSISNYVFSTLVINAMIDM